MKKILLPVILTITVLSACKKTETFSTFPLSDYNLQTPGKYITYRLDSLLFVDFGSRDTIVSYFAKDVVDAQVTDNLGRPAYRIFHYIRKTENDPWQPDNTFLTVPTDFSIEFIENNLRYIKLQQPLKEGFSWKGNAYLDTYDANSATSGITDWDLTYLDDWDYVYQDINQPLSLGNTNLDSTVTVVERDEFSNDSTIDIINDRNYFVEKYAKGIGLVYRNFYHREYQPSANGNPGYNTGYGVALTMIDHN